MPVSPSENVVPVANTSRAGALSNEAHPPEPCSTVEDADFYRFASRSNDVLIPVVMLAAEGYILLISNAIYTTLVFALLLMVGNIVISRWVRSLDRPVGLHVGLARAGVALVAVPPMVYSVGGADLAWIIGMPLILMLTAYFPPLGRGVVAILLLVAAFVPHQLQLAPGPIDLPALVILSATGIFSVPLWGRLEANYHVFVALGTQIDLGPDRRHELLSHQRHLLRGVIVSGTMFMAGVIITLAVYQHVLDIGVPTPTDTGQENPSMLLARMWLFLGAITSLAFASLVYVLFGDRAYIELMVHRRTSELEVANQQIEAANRAKSLFLATMSHELRTPMTGVIGTTDLLLANQDDPAKRELLHIIKSSGEAMITIINDILDLSRIESGKLQLEPIDFDLHRVLETAMQSMQVQADGKNVQLFLERDPAVPRYVCTDPTRLRQILINLLGNAIKFTDGGDVVVRASADPEYIYIDVEDTGIGMSPDHTGRLFRPFEQGDASTTRRYGGTGLGLAICRELCELLGGAIDVESDPGEGSTFSFYVRYREADPVPDPDQASDSPDDADSDPSCPRPRLGIALLAEDNLISQKVARRLLESHFDQVLIAENGTQALAMALEHEPDMVFMDVHMPEMDGLDATRRLRAEYQRRVPVIALTASAFPEDRRRCLESGMDDFLSKPMGATQLADVIARNLVPSLPDS